MPAESPRTTAWRAPDGTTWAITSRQYQEGTLTIAPTTQSSDTGRWTTTHDDGAERHMTWDELQATYTPIPAEPLRDPRITRLGDLVERLLGDRDDGLAMEVRAALDVVRLMPEEWSRRRVASAALAARNAHSRSTGGR